MTVRWLTARTLEGPAIAHGFFQRMGGVSDGIYESLNCGLGSRDDAGAVRENRRRVAAALSTGMEGASMKLVTRSQIHSAIVHPVTLPDADNREGDAMVSATPGWRWAF